MLRAFAALDATNHALLCRMTPHLPSWLVPAYQGLIDLLRPQP